MKVTDFGKASSREKQKVRQAILDVCDARFELLNSNLERIAKYRNTKGTVDIGACAYRDPFVESIAYPSYNPKAVHNHISEVKFEKMTGHDYEQMIRKPFQVPDNIGAEKFHNAYM